jgi:hypothetical protein
MPSKKANVASFVDVEHEAEELRDKWKLGLDPIPSLTGFERSVYGVAS